MPPEPDHDADRARRPVRLSSDQVIGEGASSEHVIAISRLRESARGSLAAWIVAALLAIVLASYLSFLALVWHGDAASFADLKDLTEVLLAPIIGIVGAVTGFYFGERHANRPAERDR